MKTISERSATAVPMRYVLVAWLFVLSAVAYLDRTNISIAGLQIGKEFGIDHAQLGRVFSAFLIGYAACQIPAGLLVHRLGSRLVLTLAVLSWGIFTILTTLVPPHMQGAVVLLVLVRFALGAGEAMMYPAATQFVERWFPIQERGKANGIIFAGVGVGSGFTPPLVTFLLLHYGWRASFWFSALLGILAGVVWYVAARDRPEEHPMVRPDELSRISEGREGKVTADADVTRDTPKRTVPWKGIFRSKEILLITASYFSFGYVAWIFFAWFYIYLAEQRGLDLRSSAFYSMLPFIGMTVGCFLGGIASDWIAKGWDLRVGRCIFPGIAMISTAVLLVFGSRAHAAGEASWLLACGAGALYVSQSCFWSVSADLGGEFAGLSSGIINMGAQIGGACTAALTPVIAARYGWNMSFLTAASLSMMGGLLWFFVNPRQRLVSQHLLDR